MHCVTLLARQQRATADVVFTREYHQAIAQVLYALDADLLRNHHCLFDGGTAIALRHGEYRESVNTDFLVSSRVGYRELRQLARNGMPALCRASLLPFEQARDVRIDQYGIRTMFSVVGRDIIVELLQSAVRKAQTAYGNAILRDLAGAIERMETRDGWMERCMDAMAMDVPKAVLWKHIRALKQTLKPH